MELRVSPNQKVFVLVSSYEERAIPKQAGFWWHGGGCKPGCLACEVELGKAWWTPKPEIAVRVVAHANEAAKAALAPYVQSLEASRAIDSNENIPAPEGKTYLPFQRAGIAYALRRQNTLIADEMGLGKTIQALGLINAKESIKRTLVITRASLKLNWKREAQAWLLRETNIEVIDESTWTPNSLFGDEEQFVIVNHDRLRNPELLHTLMLLDWDLLVVDEAQDLKNPKAHRTIAVLGAKENKKKMKAAVTGLRAKAKQLLFLTGTPISNRPVESQTLLAALDPSFDGFWFLKRYCDAKKVWVGGKNGKEVWDFSGSSNLEELQNRARSTVMIRRLKSEVLKELPPKTYQNIELPADEFKKILAKEEKAGITEFVAKAMLDEDTDSYEMLAKKLMTDGPWSTVRRELGVAKVPFVIEHVKAMLNDGVEKVIVFAHHKEVIAQLCEAFAETGCVSITGSTDMDARQQAVDYFQNSPAIRVFVGNIIAAGAGITLTASSNVVFAEQDPVPGNMDQAADRAHRIGQVDNVLVQNLIVEGSLDAYICEMLAKKRTVIAKALDGDTAFVVTPEMVQAQKPKKVYAPVTDAEHHAVHEALRTLSAYCDGAYKQDGMGFSKLDARIGKELAAKTRLTAGQIWLGRKIALKYKRQLPDGLILLMKSMKAA